MNLSTLGLLVGAAFAVLFSAVTNFHPAIYVASGALFTITGWLIGLAAER